jgi:predicted MFS family arabinose efflux permease
LLGDAFGWRNAFIIAGLPGLLIAVAVALFIREPRRAVPKAERPKPDGNLFSTLALIVRIPTFRWVAAAGVCQSTALYGLGAFTAPFFLRAHGDELAAMSASIGLKTTGLLGMFLGLSIGLAGALGNFLGGFLGDRFAGKSIAAYMGVPAVLSLLSVPLFMAVFHLPGVPLAMVALALGQACGNSYMGGMHATCQGLVRPRHRATMSAFILVILNLIGLSVGPPAVGMMSDYARETLGMADKDALGMALTLISLISLIGAVCFWRATRRIDADTVS